MRTVGVYKESFCYTHLLEKGGNRVVNINDKVPDEVALLVVDGSSLSINRAKMSRVPYVVVAKGAPIGAFSKYYIKGNLITKYEYPNVLFIETNKDPKSLQAECLTLLLEVLAECLGALGSAVVDRRSKEAQVAGSRLKSMLNKPLTTEEIITECAAVVEQLDGITFRFFIDYLIALQGDESYAHARFYSVFSALFLNRRFTNIDFCVILPYMDSMRARMLAQSAGLPLPIATPKRCDNAERLIAFVEDLLPTEKELIQLKNRFDFLVEDVHIEIKPLLNDYLLATEYLQEDNLYTNLVKAGYFDALIE